MSKYSIIISILITLLYSCKTSHNVKYLNGMTSFTKMNDALDSISKINNNPIVCYYHRN